MGSLVTYRLDEHADEQAGDQAGGAVATVTMDDGKVNVLSVAMLAEINQALDRAEADHAVVVLTGRAGVFSAGFDLAVLRAGGDDAATMLRSGFDLAERLLSFPTPVVIACTGHAIAMGVFLVLSGDYRLGVDGSFKLTANEVAIGLTLPYAAIEVCRQRLTPAAFNRFVILAEPFAPGDAVGAGILDRVVATSELGDVARSTAVALAGLDLAAHAATKLRVREASLRALRTAIDSDFSVPA
jgi:enoyl-CoA hydratase